mmetsp:Transcript_23088/g.52072  ORF Transcript_23088/g.52072 Transcript_23088/m.52072 type:complete len:383 (+) Transcript_23088:102-1250(+)
MSVPVTFSLGVLGGLVANICLMKLNTLHKGCANVCTLCQFLFGFSETLRSPMKRKLLFATSGGGLAAGAAQATGRRLSNWNHLVFSLMFFVGPYLGNLSCIVTEKDFYPVFLVVRSCGSVSSMVLGYLLAGKTYSRRQVTGVLIITAGAGLTTLGCYQGSQAAKLAEGASGGLATTSAPLWAFGLLLLVLNLINDSGLGVLQARIFAPHLAEEAAAKKAGKPFASGVVDEAVVVMGAVGTLLMALIAGPEVMTFLRAWFQRPTWWVPPLPPGLLSAGPPLGLAAPPALPLELLFVSANFVGNWNAKKICTWLNAHASAVVSALVPMFYRLLSTVISTQFAGIALPLYTWAGIAMVLAGSLTYLLAPAQAAQKQKGDQEKKKK